MREMLSLTSAIMGKGPGKDVALINDGRFSARIGTRARTLPVSRPRPLKRRVSLSPQRSAGRGPGRGVTPENTKPD